MNYKLCRMAKRFHVVEFPEEEADGKRMIDIIPSCWISSDRNVCFWPSGWNGSISRAVKNEVQPDNSWSRCPITILGSAGNQILIDLCEEKFEGVWNVYSFNLKNRL